MPSSTNISDLRELMGNFTLVAKVTQKSKTVVRNGKNCAKAIIEDGSGKITLNLYGNQVDQVGEGQIVKITGVFTEVREGFLEISSWKDIELAKEA